LDRHQEALRFCRLLDDAGYPTMLAGGCVRDRLFGLEPADYDLATAAPPLECMAALKDAGYKPLPVGIEYGAVRVATGLQTLDIATLRRDLACYGRKAKVAFTRSFEEDARRRDLTINALYEDQRGEIHDYVGGLEDLRAKRLRFVGAPRERIREDFLRILRYFRFLARLGWPADEGAMRAIAAEASNLTVLSLERVYHEMSRLLAGAHAGRVLPLMAETGALSPLYPWSRAEDASRLAGLLDAYPERDPVFCWFAFFYWAGARPSPDFLRRELVRLKFSRAERRAIAALRDLWAARARPAESLRLGLRLLERDMAEPPALLAFMNACDRVELPAPRAPVRRLVQGWAAERPPNPPASAILEAPAADRNRLVELAKIYWCLGWGRDKTRMAEIMRRERESWAALNAEKLAEPDA